MKATIRYVLFGVLLIPALPVLYWQGRRVRKKVPKLAEATDPVGQTDPALGNANRKINVLLLGESTFAGVGVKRHVDGFAGSVSLTIATLMDANVSWQVLARSGYTVKKVRENLLPKFSGEAPDLVVLGVGGNDAFKLNNPVWWKREVRNLIGDIQQRFPDVPIVFAALPPIREFPAFPPLMQNIIGGLVELLTVVLEREVEKHPHVYLQQPAVVVKDWLATADSPLSIHDLFSDGVHPNAVAYRHWGEHLGKYIVENRVVPSLKLNLQDIN